MGNTFSYITGIPSPGGMMGFMLSPMHNSSSSSKEKKSLAETFSGGSRFKLLYFKNEKELNEVLKRVTKKFGYKDFMFDNMLTLRNSFLDSKSFDNVERFNYRDLIVLKILLYDSNYEPNVNNIVLLSKIIERDKSRTLSKEGANK